MSKFYMDTEAVNAESIAYNNYLELLNKKFNNITTKKVFLITLNKNFSNFRSLGFFAEFNESFKNNYEKFLNTIKTFKFLFKEDVLTDSNFKTDIQPKAKVLMIPDLKKLQY